MKRKIFAIILLAASHFILCSFSGALGWHRQVVIVPVLSVLSIIISNKKLDLSPSLSLLTIAPFLVVYTAVSFFAAHNPLTYPIWAIGIIVSILTPLFLKYKTRPALAVSTIAIIIFMGGVFVWPNTYSYTTSQKYPERYKLNNARIVDVNNRDISLDQFKGQIVLFDIWHSACLPCIKQFPEIQKLYDCFESDSLVRIISLNFPITKDSGIRPARFTEQYSFEKMYFFDETEYKKFSIEMVPLILIMDKEFKCRYAGQLNTDWNIFIGNAKRIINKLKNE